MSPYSEWQAPRNVRSTTVLTIKFNNKILPLPLPDMDLKVNIDWSGAKQMRAPFLNRSEILYDMLDAAFVNWAERTPKQMNTIQTMNRGSGKSRLQLEWIYQALNNPSIIERFLNNTEPKILLKKKTFINVLYDSAYRQRIIIVTGHSLADTPSSDAKSSKWLFPCLSILI